MYDITLLNWENIKDENIKKIEDIDIYEKIKDIEDIYVIMLGDGGVISGKGNDAIWDNVSDNQNNYSLRFRYAGWTDTNRLLQNSNKILDVFQQSNKNFGKDFYKTITRGGKTRKRSKRQSKSKTQRRRKSKTQRRRKSTLKKGGAKSKRRYRK